MHMQVNELEEMIRTEDDEDMKLLAKEELEAIKNMYRCLLDDVVESMLPKDPSDCKECVVEVRAGAGGEEACLFAKDLFMMYQRYCSIKGWQFEVVEVSESDLGGYKLASATVSGKGDIYGTFKFESGVHRVQRVPATESSGRIHTSASSVTVLPQAEPVDVQIMDEDLRIDVYRSSGAGGQHVNTTNSAVRITHIPSGLSVAIQDERSQHKNKSKALSVLRARLYDAEQQKLSASTSSARRQQIGSGDRSERVRTYNFPQGRITDHRVGFTLHDMDAMLRGEALDEFIQHLRAAAKAQATSDFFSSSTS